MATNLNTGGIRPVTLPNQIAPMPAVARILARFDRAQLHGFIAVAIDLADALDGEADLEDATDLEDDFNLTRRARGYDTGPGCEISDKPEEDDPQGECSEDEISTSLHAQWGTGAGCELSDCDSAVDDRECDPDEGV